MLTIHPDVDGAPCRDAIASAVWIDLLDPTPEDCALVLEATGVRTPNRDALSEIESSSRLQAEGETLRLSAPLLAHADTPRQTLTPVGFIVSPTRLITVRFAKLRVFDQTLASVAAQPGLSSGAIFTQLLEAVVDRDADVLENLARELETLSHELFRVDPEKPGRRVADSGKLRNTLASIGQIGDRLSEIRASLLGIGRIVPFVCEVRADWLEREHFGRLNAVRQDIASLDNFEEHLANKAQFLLDAVLGFINTQQNELFKVLTIVSVVGVPPTLVASVYGMNFHVMPELSWTFGYPYALVLIVASAVLPVLWFKWKKWW